MSERPFVTCVVITRNRFPQLANCVSSLLKSNYASASFEVIVVDNGSDEETLRLSRETLGAVTLIETGRNLLTSAAANVGMNNGKGDYFFVLADDNIVAPDTISVLVNEAQKIGPCILGPKTYFKGSEHRIFSVGTKISLWSGIHKSRGASEIDVGQFQENWSPDSVHNALFMDKVAVQVTGGFDVKNFPMHNEEADLCLRARMSGISVKVIVDAIVWHGEYEQPYIFRFGTNDFCIESPLRAYLTGRNRVALIRRHGNRCERLLFYLVALLPSIMFYCLMIGYRRETRSNLRPFLRGSLDGIRNDVEEFSTAKAEFREIGSLETQDNVWNWIYDG